MKKFEQNLEKSEEEPKISYHILYGFHRTAKDFEKLKDVFEKADVYVAEEVGWDPYTLETYNNVSLGKIKPEELADDFDISKNSAAFKELDIIYNSKKPILLADVPRGHKLLEKRDAALELMDFSYDLFKKGEFPPSFTMVRDACKNFEEYTADREELIKANLKGIVEATVHEHPELKNKKEVKVLLMLGFFHTPVYQDLKKEGQSISREFMNNPAIFNILCEIARRLRLSKNKEVPNELFAKLFVELLLTKYLGKITDDSNKVVMVLRKMISKLKLKDVAEISKELGENPGTNGIEVLEKHNIKIPKSEEEMDEMLGVKK